MLDRVKAPAYKTIDKIEILKAVPHTLNNGMEMYSVSAGSQEITRLEFIFKAGMFQQPATLIASLTNTMLESGTKNYTADQLAESLDFFGSFLELSVDQDYATITLYALNKYLKPSLKYIEEIIKYPTFPEDEFRILLANRKQRHAINSLKVNVLAKRKFSELIFGSRHPYGVAINDVDFQRVGIDEIKSFFKTHYHYKNCCIVASGNLPTDLPETINQFFGNDNWGHNGGETLLTVPLQSTVNKKNFIEVEGAVQSAIRIGRVLFNKKHPDYFKFQVLNTILGGYFGSRLMANIREEKGYTYGIGSGLNNLLHTGNFYITTEVGVDVTKNTLEEIYKELDILREQPVEVDELETVRNYILGQFLRSVDGPFALADKYKAIWEYGLDYAYYDNYLHAVKTVTPDELQALAQKYLQEQDMIECVVGKM